MSIRFILLSLSTLFVVGCSTGSKLGISNQEWNGLSPQARQHLIENYRKIKSQSSLPDRIYNGPILGVYLLKGQAVMPPYKSSSSFETTYFKMTPGQCQSINLKSIDTHQSTMLPVCYDGLRLSLDASRYELDKSHGTVYFDYNPMWKRGFTYENIRTSGFARLSNTSISIKALTLPH